MDTRFTEPYSDPRWWWEGSYIPACFECAHFRGAIKGKVVCTAFPEGIPAELTLEDSLHDKPYQGDHGIQFEKYTDVNGD